jgi:hypothetical protein
MGDILVRMGSIWDDYFDEIFFRMLMGFSLMLFGSFAIMIASTYFFHKGPVSVPVEHQVAKTR